MRSTSGTGAYASTPGSKRQFAALWRACRNINHDNPNMVIHEKSFVAQAKAQAQEAQQKAQEELKQLESEAA